MISALRTATICLTCLAAMSVSACLAQIPPNTPALAGTYQIDPTHASVTWKVAHMGLSFYTARFLKADAQITYDPVDPTKSKLTASVDPASVDTGFPKAVAGRDFDAELLGEKWFEVAKFPTIGFKSTKIEKTSDKTAHIMGDLTLHGVTKPVTFVATLNGAFESHPISKVAALGFSASTKIKRSDFGMTTLIPYVGDEVVIQIEAEFQKK